MLSKSVGGETGPAWPPVAGAVTVGAVLTARVTARDVRLWFHMLSSATEFSCLKDGKRLGVQGTNIVFTLLSVFLFCHYRSSCC